MKCKYCGNNLNIEDKFCPYCGRPNPFAQKHQEEMERYEKDYSETKKDVLEKSRRLNRKTVMITVIAVLIALIASCCFVLSRTSDIRYDMLKKAQAKEFPTHSAEIERLMDERDYLAVNAYVEENQLSYITTYEDAYSCVMNASNYYKYFYVYLMELQGIKKYPDKYVLSEEEGVEHIAEFIHTVYECGVPQEYNKESFTENNKAYVKDLTKEMETMVQGYFGLSDEDIEKMRTMSEAKIVVLLEGSHE